MQMQNAPGRHLGLCLIVRLHIAFEHNRVERGRVLPNVRDGASVHDLEATESERVAASILEVEGVELSVVGRVGSTALRRTGLVGEEVEQTLLNVQPFAKLRTAHESG